MKKILVFAVIVAFALSSILTGYAKSGVKWKHEVAVKTETQLAAKGTTENKVETQTQTVLKPQEQVQSEEELKEKSQEDEEEIEEIDEEDTEENSDLPPVIKDGNTLIPIKAIAKGLDAKVSWDPTTKTITIIKGDKTIQYTLGESKALVNGVEVAIDKKMNENATFVPVKFFAEILGVKHDKVEEKIQEEIKKEEKNQNKIEKKEQKKNFQENSDNKNQEDDNEEDD
ncbi:MAG TPA: copper amine oxidase N-terminal domain-containing protein [Clostridia bacterium]|nr:copper amine oxidase N-terminal domain-containing protein [Clostridia bacterium]